MFVNAIYGVLEAISYGVYTFVATIWHIEEALINLMMSTFLLVLSLACHPIMVIPMILFCAYVLRNFWYRRAMKYKIDDKEGGDGGPMAGIRNTPRTPRLSIPSYRSFAAKLAEAGANDTAVQN
ncbi:uncharacterized protein [Drosophila kikkawai]|uniref:Uncharacterized protein n=1 Tax=Drosophila kikkawai TaxID=30033 RepID=A0A6P4IXY9_DROKI|nr:uncharacterized protein LOC108078460 [Drosophila kikkawai]KAH8314309.1 hypothetical protein KR059_000591 [Drosophila kikkawai]